MLRSHPGAARLRLGALTALSAVALHELSYLSVDAPADGGHGYLGIAAPLVAVLAASVVFGLVLRAVRGSPPPPRRTRPMRGRAIRCALALLSIFIVQEVAEGVLSSGHATPGFHGLIGHYLLAALPLALALGLLVSVLARGLETTERAVAGGCTRRKLGAPARPRRPRVDHLLRGRPQRGLAFGFARRPPPFFVVTG